MLDIERAKGVIQGEVAEYRSAQENLEAIERAENKVNEEFADQLVLIADLQTAMAERMEQVFTEFGITLTEKQYEAMLKDIRQRLFQPTKIVITDAGEGVMDKTYAEADFSITLVEQKPKLAVTDASLNAHKHDVQLLLDNNMWTSLEIKADEDTLSWMRLREKNEEESLQSVGIVESGYVKVKLS